VQLPPPAEPPSAVQRPAPAPVSPPQSASTPPAAAPSPAAAPAPAEARREASSPTAEEDEAVIRRVVATYARAIENKDINLFRTVKPNLSREEQRRLEDGFRAVSKQSVNATILSIERRGQESLVALRRRDTIQAGGRQQTTDSQQTLTMARTGSAWVITEIR
jgi:hypothetical protein